MKTLFSIAMGLMILLSSVIAQAVPSSQPTYVTVQVTIHNKSSAQSLKYRNFSYTRSFSDMSSYILFLSPVNPSLSESLLIKIPTKPAPISASFVYGYDSDNYCLFLFSYKNNQLSVTVTPHGSVNCGTPVVSRKSVTLTINQRGQQQQQSATNKIHFTIVNDSSLPLTYYKSPTSSLGPVSTSGLASILPNSKLTLTSIINRSLPKGALVQIDYGISKNTFCTFSLPIPQLGIKATVIKATPQTATKKILCTVGNDNSMHVNVNFLFMLCP